MELNDNRETLSVACSQLGAKTMAIQTSRIPTRPLHAAFAQVGRQFGRIDVLFASAGVVFPTPLENTSSDNIAFELLRSIAYGRFGNSK